MHDSPGAESGPRNRQTVLVLCGCLLVAIAVVFGQTVRHEFVNYDDERYVVDNPHVARGLTARGIAWAFTESHASNWHPLTWVSHMVDCQLYGLKHPGGHHLTNVLLHALTAVLLFLVLLRMTADTGPSAFVSALFAVHPLHVESVAWVAERKDVLSGLFFVLTLLAYLRYVRAPYSLRRYLLVLVSFALGLMSKAMLVTVPFVLLLLDYWPLGRFSCAAPEDAACGNATRRSLVWLLVEKMPLFVVAIASSVITYVAQGPARGSGAEFPLWARIANAIVSYMAYLVKVVYPVGLAVFYPHPGNTLPIWKVVGACLVLIAISAGVLACRRRHPYLLVGWLWYLGMLVPVIGLVQVGSQAMADRYTYLTQIGLYMAVAWGAVNVAGAWSLRPRALEATAFLVIVVLAGCAWRQVSFWRDSETLWTHALASTSGNYEAHNNLARILAGRGQVEAAISHYRQALQIKPDFVDARNNLGNALAARGQIDAAIAQYQQALRRKPDFAEAHNNLALVLAASGQTEAAIAHFQKCLDLEPDFAEAHYNLGNVLAGRGQIDAAVAQYEQALDLRPDFAEAHYNLGNVLAGRGQIDAAIAHYQKALAINPGFASARRNLALVVAERERIQRARQAP